MTVLWPIDHHHHRHHHQHHHHQHICYKSILICRSRELPETPTNMVLRALVYWTTIFNDDCNVYNSFSIKTINKQESQSFNELVCSTTRSVLCNVIRLPSLTSSSPLERPTLISKLTVLGVKVDIILPKQKLYSPPASAEKVYLM